MGREKSPEINIQGGLSIRDTGIGLLQHDQLSCCVLHVKRSHTPMLP